MALSEKNFFKGKARLGATAEAVEEVDRYGYESAKILYDVTVWRSGRRMYSINSKDVVRTRMHERIEEHFRITPRKS